LLGIFAFSNLIMLFIAEVLLFVRRFKVVSWSGCQKILLIFSRTNDQWILHYIVLVGPDGRGERGVVWRRDHCVAEAIY